MILGLDQLKKWLFADEKYNFQQNLFDLSFLKIITGKELAFLPKEAVENAMEAEVTGVDLSKNYLDKFPPQLEPLMKQLYELNLSSNRLTVLTPSIIGLGKN